MYLYFSKMQMSAMLEKQDGILVLMAIPAFFSTDHNKTLYICYKFIDIVLNCLFKRNAATFVFHLGYTALNIHEIWPCLLWGKHTLCIRAKMTSF